MSSARPLLLCLSLVLPLACDVTTDDVGLAGAGAPSLRLELTDDGGNGHGAGGANVAGSLEAAVAVIHAVTAHVAGSGWHTIMEGRVEVDFLRLAQHAADLGVANIPPGKVTQLRLYVLDDEDAYVRDSAGATFPLLTPSGSQSGIKVKGTWRLEECQAGVLTLTTNGKKAIHIHGRGGSHDDYILRPVIRASGYSAEDVEGCVPGGGGGDGVPGGGGDGEPGGGGDGEPGGGGGDDDGTPGEEGCFDPESGTFGACPGGGAGGGGGTDVEGGDGTTPSGGSDDDGEGGGTDVEGGAGTTPGGGEGGGSDGAGDEPAEGDDTAPCYDPESGGFYAC